jgi:hypothetical protein
MLGVMRVFSIVLCVFRLAKIYRIQVLLLLDASNSLVWMLSLILSSFFWIYLSVHLSIYLILSYLYIYLYLSLSLSLSSVYLSSCLPV